MSQKREGAPLGHYVLAMASDRTYGAQDFATLVRGREGWTLCLYEATLIRPQKMMTNPRDNRTVYVWSVTLARRAAVPDKTMKAAMAITTRTMGTANGPSVVSYLYAKMKGELHA